MRQSMHKERVIQMSFVSEANVLFLAIEILLFLTNYSAGSTHYKIELQEVLCVKDTTL